MRTLSITIALASLLCVPTVHAVAQIVEYNPSTPQQAPVQEPGMMSFMNDKFNGIDRSLQDLGDRADRAEHALNKVQQLEARIAELEKKVSALATAPAHPPANSSASGVAITSGSGASAGSGSDAGGMSAEESEAAQTAYKKGFDQLMAGKYTEAGTAFKSFVEKYPKSDQLSNAYYWLGETHFLNRKFDSAVKAYEQSANLKGSKEGDALLKQGQCLIELNQKKKAQEILEHVAQEFGDTNAGKQAEKALAGLKAKK